MHYDFVSEILNLKNIYSKIYGSKRFRAYVYGTLVSYFDLKNNIQKSGNVIRDHPVYCDDPYS